MILDRQVFIDMILDDPVFNLDTALAVADGEQSVIMGGEFVGYGHYSPRFDDIQPGDTITEARKLEILGQDVDAALTTYNPVLSSSSEEDQKKIMYVVLSGQIFFREGVPQNRNLINLRRWDAVESLIGPHAEVYGNKTGTPEKWDNILIVLRSISDFES